jgi:hypothetical protein
MCLPRIALWIVALASGVLVLAHEVAPPDWALRVSFPAEPKGDNFKAPTPMGDVVSDRYSFEGNGETLLLVRSTYPMAIEAARRDEIYDKAKADAVRGRGGEIAGEGAFQLGEYEGRELRVRFTRAKRARHLRFVLIGSTLYALVHEQPDDRKDSPLAAAFWASVALRPGFEDPRAVGDRERWREIGQDGFRVRYDATRWYRDPSDNEVGIFNLLRADQRAEAQLIVEAAGTHHGPLEEAALATAREGSESVRVKGKKVRLRHGVNLTELHFEARVDSATYVNRGCYYSGPGGQVQLRAWATDRVYKEVAGDIDELLEGLVITRH